MTEHVKPSEIEARSFEIIAQELAEGVVSYELY